ncbi:sensor histidine kinase [Microbacterium sp. CFBP9034]|uniref:sensor histidine kinase n=1 Tax=Microbacterium sp. CFBP9034 TaxID=3096540 RepID=UPI002A6AFDCA|nr:histidine kinase [Microbacterium sp. CFBP9034]MDY0910885.1 histidine kinase [Microbacterium sp. CFBP9034]
MKTRTDPDAGAPAAAARATLRLNRGITATWWYTVTAIVFLEVMIVGVWLVALLDAGLESGVLLAIGVGGLLWVASTLPLLFDYRLRTDASAAGIWPRAVGPLLVAVLFGAVAVVTTGSWLIALLPVSQTLMLLNWPRGVRLRVVLGVTLLLGIVWMIDAQVAFAAGGRLEDAGSWALLGFYSALLPTMTVASLWWWDVLATLDLARASEARLAATQERLRVATDVHDLQGHHLQVIALQLELTEKLLERDPDAALQTLRAARASVDEARQGTRDLATRFRSVPLGDEIANARDLLIAAGIAAEASVGPDVDRAPASDFGPVIRETTTNVLRHGGGRRARLSLEQAGDAWRYEISNDVAAHAVASSHGSGLDGVRRRIAEAGGRLEVRHTNEDFTVIVTIPVRQEQRP